MDISDIDFSGIDFSQLMDLRVDYAFKLFFAAPGATHRLISLLNAIFENKRIPRAISKLTVVNPALEKAAVEDKLAVLDVRAILEDGTSVCIEMHLYELVAHKHKSMRSWARVYGEELEQGQSFTDQNLVIHISFMDGPVTDAAGVPIDKVHSIFQVMERDSHELLLDSMELHYINMQAFLKQCEEMAKTGASHTMFTRWLTLITQKAISDKETVKKICTEEEIREAMKTLTRLSQDKVKRQAYQRRQDELYYYNLVLSQNAENEAALAENAAALAEKDAALAEKDAALAENAAALAEKDAALAEKDAIIAELMAQPHVRIM